MEKVNTVKQWKELQLRCGTSNNGLVCHFSASWCEPCKLISSFLASKVDEFKGHVVFVEIDGDQSGDICALEEVDRVPLVLFYRPSGAGMEIVAEVSGANMEELQQNMVSLYGAPRSNFPSLNDYLKFLTSRPGVFLFITGTPSRPRCGFSGKLCELMSQLQVPYLFYDVMSSDEVCEGLKVFSEWPTYPQVYVDGELIGGLDICKELHESGNLKMSLKCA